MNIDEWFHDLRKKVETIEEKWPGASEEERLQLVDQLYHLRQVSDTVVDHWLQFEERLSETIRRVKEMEGQLPPAEGKVPAAAANEAASTAASIQDENEADAPKKAAPDSQKKESNPYEPMFRRGEGFYHLRMYQDAKKCFAELIEQSPDWESGRLYYAYSLLFSEEREAALREFRLLSRSASSPAVVAISYNAIGCILAEERKWLEAAQAFKQSLEVKPDQEEARYNLALCYFKDGDAKEALDEIEKCLHRDENDWEAQLLWLRAAQKLQAMDVNAELTPPASLQLPSRELDNETLQEMASLYESAGNYHRAQVCYHFLTERLPREGWAWHGLAWNTWLIAGTKRAITLLKKAISLSPQHNDFIFSYGWMLLFDGDVDKAMAVFRRLLERDRDNRLGQSGMISAYEKLGELQAAKRLAKQFADDPEPYVQSLGYFHLGRLALVEENWRLAEQYFRRILPHADQFREVPVYMQLCASKLGEPVREIELLSP
ncbi:tetratricopeptide repeat protein [Brevibacillus sp. GCM10020057]|uniref:tetratricopeptide repeat protein n=1 Tax=Brevibacillus sp. GCM10020057 TaxID=3317327 RepID=UPI0036264A0D